MLAIDLFLLDALDLDLQLEVFIDPLLFFAHQIYHPFFEGIESILFLLLLYLPLIELGHDLQIFEIIFLFLELLEAIVEGELLLLASVFVEQILEVVVVGALFLFIVFDTDGIV